MPRPVAPEPPRFLVDAMLGNVARDLRLLGFDCAFARDLPDPALLRQAQQEGRVLVTRDRELARLAAGVRCILVAGVDPEIQALEVLSAAGAPHPPGPLPRCLECNGVLEPLGPEEARPLVPDHIALAHPELRRCPGCGRVYWPGSHHGRLARRARRLAAALLRPAR